MLLRNRGSISENYIALYTGITKRYITTAVSASNFIWIVTSYTFTSLNSSAMHAPRLIVVSWFLLNREDDGDKFLRNGRYLSADYTGLYAGIWTFRGLRCEYLKSRKRPQFRKVPLCSLPASCWFLLLRWSRRNVRPKRRLIPSPPPQKKTTIRCYILDDCTHPNHRC
jgi:hypothetical protein